MAALQEPPAGIFKGQKKRWDSLDFAGRDGDNSAMSLPPGFIDELRGRLSLGQVVGRKVMWDNRKSNPGKGDLWAPCPFHQEKSASFHVDDRKGFYYCFGCHAKGDAISFVRETENVSFVEAVEILAREAGMPLPERDPQAQVKADHRTLLVGVMEQAVQWFRLQLKTGAAAEARAYLLKRGLSEAAQGRWDIGFAPDARQGLFAHLAAKGVDPGLVIDAGLAAVPDGGGTPFDRFRGRIIFPIKDARGRPIALGGRAMDPAAKAKYLNSPETELFDKGRGLYNIGPAREAAGKGQPLVVAEGYMDVIALSEAGFGAVVAPLGTAITEDQLRLMWRISPEPIITLDGDTAGQRAAMRVIDLALPLLEAGQGLRFAVLPQGLDPDDLIRAQGAGAMRAVLDAAVPMVDLLWSRETMGREFDSPERKATLDKTLRAVIATIKDPSIRGHYGEAIKQMRWALFGQRKPVARAPFVPGRFGKAAPALATAGAKTSLLAGRAEAEEHLSEAVILATLIGNPQVLAGFENDLEQMECRSPGHAQIRDAILRHQGLRAEIVADLGDGPLEKLFSQPDLAIMPAIRQVGDSAIARLRLAEHFAKLQARRGHAREIVEAMEDMAGRVDEGLTWRLARSAASVETKKNDDSGDQVETVTADNGVVLDKSSVEFSRKLYDNLLAAKPEHRGD